LRVFVPGSSVGVVWSGSKKCLQQRRDLDFDRAADQVVAHGTRTDLNLDEIRYRIELKERRPHVNIEVTEPRVDIGEAD
jgi:hypothetical protein